MEFWELLDVSTPISPQERQEWTDTAVVLEMVNVVYMILVTIKSKLWGYLQANINSLKGF